MSEHSEPTYEQLADELRGMRAEAYLHKRLAEQLQAKLDEKQAAGKLQVSDVDRLITQLSEGFKQSLRENIFDDNQEYLLDYVNRLAASAREEFLTPLQLSEDEILRELAARLSKPNFLTPPSSSLS